MENILSNLADSDLERIAIRTADLILMRIGAHTLAPMAQHNQEEIPHHIPDWQSAQKVAEHLGVSVPYVHRIAEKHPELKRTKRLELHHKRARTFFDLTGLQLFINHENVHN